MSFVAAPGRVLEGRYVLREQLGHGGMGTVWRAEHTKLKTPVAVKLVSAAMIANDETHARFRREAQVAASLESPNIVRVLDFGVEDDTPFIAMELLQGETLGARLARAGALAPENTARIVAQIARAMTKAHGANVVHCDLKPENVFLAQVDGEEIVKVVDFGIAKAPAFDPVTKTGAVLGTLQYMSPEQLEGRKGIGAPSDLYSLGVIAFECLCGRPAFKADSIAELVRRICGAPLPVPSEIARVPAGFDAWFLRAAHRNPSSRFANARALSDSFTALAPAPSTKHILERPAERDAVAFEPTVNASRVSGNEQAGYRISPDPRGRKLELELWGLWEMPLALACKKDLIDSFALMRGAPRVRLVLLERHPPQKDDVQELKRPLMSDPALDECERAAMVVDSSLTQMQVSRLFTEGGNRKVRFFMSEIAARAWLADASVFARRAGDTRAGFSVTSNPLSRVATLEMWGLWDVPLAKAFQREVGHVSSAMGPAPWVSLSNTSRHPPQNEEVQDLKTAMMAIVRKQGLTRTATIIKENAVGQMQARRLFAEGNMADGRVFTDETEGRAWLWESDVLARRGGNERAGFTTHPNPYSRMVTFEFWGEWDAALLPSFRAEMLRAYDEMDGAPYVALTDSRRFMMPSEEVQHAHRDLIGIGLRHGLARVAVLLDSAVGKMQAARKEAGSLPHLRFFTDETEARAWLAEAKTR